MNIIVV